MKCKLEVIKIKRKKITFALHGEKYNKKMSKNVKIIFRFINRNLEWNK